VSAQVLVTGARGQLGTDLVALSGTRWGFGSADLDVTSTSSVAARVAEFAAVPTETRPVLINAAAYTAVDAAESDVDGAFAVNARGPEILAAECARHDVALVHVSTDYVFSGDGTRPYEPTDATEPRTVYGRSKLAGEQAVLAAGGHVVRTAWVYGAGGGNFVKTMLRLEKQRETLSVVDDQRGSPTWTRELAGGLLELAEKLGSGDFSERVLHCAGGGDTTWFSFTRAIFAEVGADPSRVNPCRTTEFPRPAPRPAYSVLSDASWRAAGLTPLPPWSTSLHIALSAGGFST
jgi:dTDP-4-dehydrorhamnose reductase